VKIFQNVVSYFLTHTVY